MNIWILNPKKEVIGSLSNDSTLSCPFWNDLQIQKLTDFDSSYTFTVPCNHEESNLLIAGNMIVIPDLDDDLILYRITQVEDGILDSTSGAHTKIVTCLDQYIFDLVNTFVSPQTFTNGLGRDIFNHILEGTGWVVNREEYIGAISTFTIEENTTAQAAMQAFVRSSTASDPNSGLDATDITNFVCEPKFYIKMAGGQITDYCVDLFVQRGEDTGKRFEYTKDIAGVTRTEDISNLYTALKLVGGTDIDKKYTDTDVLDADGNPTTITVRSVNNHLDYVYDDVANELYNPGGTGYLMGIATNSTITEPQALLNWGNNKLKQFNHPQYTYTVDVVMLEDYGFTAEQVRLGDNVRVLDLSMNPPLVLEARVIEMDISYSDPSQNKVVLGDYIELSLGDTPSQIDGLIGRIDQAQSTADGAASTASSAQSTANQAASDASDAKQKATDALTSANGKNTNFYGADTPENPISGDLWFQPTSGGGVTILQYDGTEWKSNIDQGILDAQKAASDASKTASDAQTSANGKNTVYRQSNQPTGTFTTGDIWFDTSNGNRASVWDGSTWQLSQFQGLAVGNIDAGSITTGYLSASRFLANSIDASVLKTGSITAYNGIIGSLNANSLITGTIDANYVTVKNLTASSISSLNGVTASGSFTSQSSNGMISTLNAGSVNVSMTSWGANKGMTISAQGISYADPSNYHSNFNLNMNGTSGISMYCDYGMIFGASLGPIDFQGANGHFFSSQVGIGNVNINNNTITNTSTKLYANGYGGVQITDTSGSAVLNVGGSNTAITGSLTTTSTISSNSTVYGSSFSTGGNTSTGSLSVSGTSSFSGVMNSTGTVNNTTTSSANMYITVSGNFAKSTSARKYKLDEQPVDNSIAYKILDVVPKTWFDRNASEQYTALLNKEMGVNPDGTTTTPETVTQEEWDNVPFIERIPGVVAEDVEAAGLSQYVVYNDPDANGNREIEGVQYDRLWTLLIPIVKELKQNMDNVLEQNNSLITKNANLENRIATLEQTSGGA
ncbi:phage tail spike protein [Heyndrickxia acidicola]|uniref:Phage tail spike protein n=1 Tax=Heyndrickxia acidicola TaxID=209389 RepID=A0ABU6MPE8_9BACI|nr:phage tail spike protein [Heyndrickxia acidicola]MED1205851.1 phage tail spike protein [Heyndrickxia acidicola]